MKKRRNSLITPAFVLLVALAPTPICAQEGRQSLPPRQPGARQGLATEQSGGLVASLRATGHFTKLLALIETAGMTETLSDSTKSLTLFAPDDDAFALLPAVLVSDLNSDPAKARGFILPYILTGKLLTKDLASTPSRSRLRTFAGTTLRFSNGRGGAGLLVIFDARSSGVGGSPIGAGADGSKAWPCCGWIVSADHVTANGIYHVINFAAGGSDEWR